MTDTEYRERYFATPIHQGGHTVSNLEEYKQGAERKVPFNLLGGAPEWVVSR